MKVREYSYLCSQKLLEEIASDKYAKSLHVQNDSIKTLSKEYPCLCPVNIKWQLISTALLMSEGLYKNEKTYSYITPEMIGNLEDKLMVSGLNDINQILDSENQPTIVFASLFPNRIRLTSTDETRYFYDYKGDEIAPPETLEEDPFWTDEKPEEDLSIQYLKTFADDLIRAEDSNSSILNGKKIDILQFIKMIRNALAHSSYEILNNNAIRVFHYNHAAKKLDLNVVLDQDTIITIIDILNEIVYKKYAEFNEFYLCDDFYNGEYFGKFDTGDDRLIEFIMSFDICNKEVAKRILNKAKENLLFFTPSYDSDLTMPTLEDYDNANQLKAICQTINAFICPLCDYGIVINDLLYTQNNYIVSDELYEKYGVYEYLQGEFFPTTYALSSDPKYLENELKLKILSFLNCLLLTINNEVHNNNLASHILDFSAMSIPEDIVKHFEEKHFNRNAVYIKRLRSELEANLNDSESIRKRVDAKKIVLEEKYRDIDYFNITLPEEIKKLELQQEALKSQRIIKNNLLIEISKDLIGYRYNEEMAIYILNALRNSLAHGNVRFDENYSDLGDMLITFEDYSPENQTDLTFKGTIALGDLIKILISKENIDILKR